MAIVGLCMIVKDEAHVIERCLSSVRSALDHWTIVDTGSTDGTQDLIRRLLADIPGTLHERPWVDFGHNRTEALGLARTQADYSLVIDADEELLVPASFVWPALTADTIFLLHQQKQWSFWRGSLVANHLPWRYVGVLHEYLAADRETSSERLEGPVVLGHFDGGRSQGLSQATKYARDAGVLETALVGEPANSRYQYYLARSYKDSAQSQKALAAFRRRAEMGGFAEEVADSLLEVGRLLQAAPADEALVIDAYLRAWEYRPSRAEPLAALARYLREHERYEFARLIAERARQIPRPSDLLWIDDDVYAWLSEDEYAVSSYWVGAYAECAATCRTLLAGGALPAQHRPRVQENLRLSEDRLAR